MRVTGKSVRVVVAAALPVALPIVLMVAATPAFAVTLVNRDKAPRDAVINHADGKSDFLTLKPGQRIANVCDSCVILVGDTSVEATGPDVVVIEGGKASRGR